MKTTQLHTIEGKNLMKSINSIVNISSSASYKMTVTASHACCENISK